MSESNLTPGHHEDSAPGDDLTDHGSPAEGVRNYLIGLAIASGLTVASFVVAQSGLVWGPGIAVALIALAIGQMGVHLVFFLHITTGPDNTNNTLALAFGALIVFLVLVGTLWIMYHLSHLMVGMDQLMKMQR